MQNVLRPFSLVAAAAAIVAFSGSPYARAAGTLVDNGQAKAVLVLPDKPANDEKTAAEEIQSHIEKISGAKLATITQGQDLAGRTPILIGQAAPAELESMIRQKGSDPCAFALVVDPSQVALRGLSPAGTRIAAYELLEQLGVRWFMPGEMGLVIPQSKSVQLADQKTVQVPAFVGRWTTSERNDRALGYAWMSRVRMGGPNFPSSHGISLAKELVPAPKPGEKAARKGASKAGTTFQEHPEYYSLIGGERKERQLCVSNPEALKMAINAAKNYFRQNPSEPWMGMGPNDGGGMCECDNCKALDGGDYDPFHHGPSMTDRYVWFFNHVLEGIKDEFPDKKIAFYAYASYQRPPVKVKPDPKIVPATAVITLCRLHGMGNPICPEKSYEKTVTAAWGKVLPEVYNRGYWYNLADPGLPFFMITRVKQEIIEGRDLGIKGWRVETADNLAAELPSVYLAAKLMWNDKADADAILRDFYEKFFGPAASPMQQYIETMDKALANADYHTGCSWDLPIVYGPEVRKVAQAALDQAAKLAPDGMYAQRVDMYRKDFAYFLAFANMLDSRFAGDYATSKKNLETVDAIGQELIHHSPPLLKPKHVEEYSERFFRKPTEEGYKRTTGGNVMVANFATQWEFQIDPERIGEAIGLWRPEHRGGNWQTLRSDLSWSDQGLRYYKGLAWYRQSVNIPASAAGKRTFLWFGGIDEKAQVWINGKSIGVSGTAVGTFNPFELDATDAIQPGKPNSVVICITNDSVNELGTGGITGPVMFWSPTDATTKPFNPQKAGKAPVRDEGVEVNMQTEKAAPKGETPAPKDAKAAPKK